MQSCPCQFSSLWQRRRTSSMLPISSIRISARSISKGGLESNQRVQPSQPALLQISPSDLRLGENYAESLLSQPHSLGLLWRGWCPIYSRGHWRAICSNMLYWREASLSQFSMHFPRSSLQSESIAEVQATRMSIDLCSKSAGAHYYCYG